MSTTNQRIVHIHKPKYQRDFMQIGIHEWKEARKVLTYSEFSFYLYLASNANNYNFELSQKKVESALGIKKTSYYDAVNRLKALGYLVETQTNRLDFYTCAVHPCGKGHKENEN